MSFSYDRAWADVVAMVRANVVLLLTLTGVFLFLPSFALWLFAPLPQPENVGDGEALKLIYGYYMGHWPAFLVLGVLSAFGQAAILSLLADRDRPTVGQALGIAGRLLPMYFVMVMMTNLALTTGLLLFLVPGIYLTGRFAIVGPVMVVERIANPLEAIRRGWTYTQGLGWRIAGFLLLVGIVGWIAFSAVSSVVGVLAGLLLPESVRTIGAAFADSVGGAGLALLLALLSAAVYRQVRGGAAPLQDIFG